MSKPVFQDLFRFAGRRNRRSYLLCMLAQVAGWIALSLLVAVAVGATDEGDGHAALAVAGLAAIPVLLLALSAWAVGAQRCRDFGWTGWAVLLTLVPYAGVGFALALFFIPGTYGPNRYGPDPVDDGHRPEDREEIFLRA